MVVESDLGNLISIILTFCAAFLGYVYAYMYEAKRKVKSNCLDTLPVTELPPLPQIKLTYAQLKRFDGTRPDGRILIAFKGKIYDVSSNVGEFGLHGTLNRVAGSDFTKYLRVIMCLNESEVNILDRWEHILDMNYQRVGILINEQGEAILDVAGTKEDESQDSAKNENFQPEVHVDFHQKGMEKEQLCNKLHCCDSSKNIINQVSPTESQADGISGLKYQLMKTHKSNSSENLTNEGLRM